MSFMSESDRHECIMPVVGQLVIIINRVTIAKRVSKPVIMNTVFMEPWWNQRCPVLTGVH